MPNRLPFTASGLNASFPILADSTFAFANRSLCLPLNDSGLRRYSKKRLYGRSKQRELTLKLDPASVLDPLNLQGGII